MTTVPAARIRQALSGWMVSIAILLSLGALPAAAQDISDTAAETEAADTAAPEPASFPASFEALVTELADASYDRKSELAAEIAATGHPRAVDVLDAFAAGELFAAENSGRIVIAADDDEPPFFDAFTGEEIEGFSGDLDKIRVNNRLRRELRGLTARLALSSPDTSVRRTAAEEAFSAADPDSLPAIQEALAKEEDDSVRRSLEQAQAVIMLENDQAAEDDLLTAIQILRDRGDQDALNALLGLNRADLASVRDAKAAAVERIERNLSYWDALQNVYYGISLGSVLLLAAIGLAITFGVMGVINMAHGEMIMLGAYTTFMVQQALQGFAPGLMEWSLLIAIPAAFLVSGAMGILIERTVIRFLYGRPLETLLATWGLSLILQQLVRTIFGPTNKPVVAPSWMSGAFDVGGLTITESRIWIIVFAMIVLGLLMAFLRYTHFGSQMRAVTQNRKMAASMGVRTNMVDAFTFGLGSGVAGIAGVALSQIDNVSPNLGQSYIIDSFMVVVFGGVGNLWGTLVGAMSLGVANKFLEPYAGAVFGKILVLVFIILFIQWRPRGLFALKGRSVEA